MSTISFSQLYGKLTGTLAPRHVIAAGFAFFLTILLSSLLAVYFLRQDSRHVAEQENSNLSILLAEQAMGAVGATDLVLTDMATELSGEKSSLMVGKPFALHSYLKDHLQNLRYVHSFFVDDAKGQSVATTLIYPAPPQNSTELTYFRRHRDTLDSGVFIDHPVKGRISGLWTIRKSKRISGPAGEFLGVITAGMDIDHFQSLYASLHLGPGDQVFLLHTDGTVMATFPSNDALLGKPAPAAVLTRLAPIDQPVHKPVALSGAAGNDDAYALVTAKRLDKYPLAVAVTKSDASIQSFWQQRARVTFSAALLIAATGLMLMLWFAKHLRRELALDRSLHRAEDSFLALTSQQIAGVAKLDVSTGRYLAVNAQFCDMTGYSEQELLNKTNRDLTHPDDQQDTRQHVAAALAGTADASSSFHKRYICKDGSIRHVVIGFNIINNPETGAAESIGLIQDITASVIQQQRLADEENRLSIIIENSMDAIITIDADEKIQIFNAAAEQMFGHRSCDALGMQLSALVPHKLRAEHHAHVQAFTRSGDTAHKMEGHMVLRGLRATGEEFPLEASISRIVSNDKIFMTVILRDLSAKIKAQVELKRIRTELRELSIASQTAREEEKSRISRELHDELGQSLTALKMDLTWLQTHPCSDELKQAERLRAMQIILASAIAETRRIAADLRPLMLDDLGLLAALEWLSQNFTHRTSVPCELVVDGAINDVDVSIQSAIYRAVQECLTNIARHAQASQVKIELKVKQSVVQLRVQDNGKGILKLDQTKHGSFGLIGMRERIYILGGSVAIEGPSSGGTHITIELPHLPSSQDITFIN